jgi:hypothetical protein
MQVGELRFERDDGMAVAGNVAGTSSASTHAQRGLDHGIDDNGVASHAEIIVGAPNDDLAGTVTAAPAGVGRPSGLSLEIDKGAIAPFLSDAIEK